MNDMTSTLVRLAKDKKKKWKLEAKHHNVSLNKYIIMRVEGEYIEQPAQKINKKSKLALKRIRNNYNQIVDATKNNLKNLSSQILIDFQPEFEKLLNKTSEKLKNKNIDDNSTSDKINNFGNSVNNLAYRLNRYELVLPAEYTDLCDMFEKLLGELS